MMQFSRYVITCAVVVALFVSLVSSQESTLLLPPCSNDTSYENGSTYATNVKSVLTLMSANNFGSHGFYNISMGENTDKVYAVSLCRGDISMSECNKYLHFATSDIYASCPTQKKAIAWYEKCMLRYSNESIIGTLDQIYHIDYNLENVSYPDQSSFKQVLGELLWDLRGQASLGTSFIKYAAGHKNYTSLGRIYALVQCTPDLSEQDCGKCLDWSFGHLENVSFAIGGRVFCGSCNYRYEIAQFYATTGDSLDPQPSPPSLVQNTEKNIMWAVIISVLSTMGFMMLLIGILLYIRAKRKRGSSESSDAGEVESTKPLQFNYEAVKAGTDNFSDNNKLGQGGFGTVYWGKDRGGQLIAVKRLAPSSGQGDVEFKNEVLLLTKLQHKNLVRLLGFCLEGDERLLIYEFMPNGSLDQLLFDQVKRNDMDWETRYKIIGGIARGILYLHEDSSYRVIHRDLKASNVLLDEDMSPKIADFGLARLFPDDQTRGQTNKVIGTYGYMAPEYGLHGQFSVKSDVYSFGVLVLELVTGRKNTHLISGDTAMDLISFAWGSWRAGTVPSIINPALEDGPRNEIIQCIHIGLLCVQESIALRPNMSFVVALLNGYSLTLPAPKVPAFHHDDNESETPMLGEQNTGTNTSVEFKGHIGNFSANDMSNTDMYPR